MYVLVPFTIEQVSPPSHEQMCRVKVTWIYGNQRPDLIEFWWQGASNSDWEPLHQTVIADENSATQEVELMISAWPGKLILCPRKTEGNTLLFYQPDDEGTNVEWRDFCLWRNFTAE